MSIHWLDRKKLIPFVLKKLLPVEIVLDVGCGIQPQNYIRPLVQICCEPYDQYLINLKKKIKNEYGRSYVLLNASWEGAMKIFPPKSVDAVYLLDVIEHLDKKEAWRLLKMTEKIARKQIVIFTPLGFFAQTNSNKKDGWGLDGGPWQEHKSGWMPQDFGKDWQIFASKDFHFPKPVGAFWAIKNLQEGERPSQAVQKKKAMLLEIWDISSRSKNPRLAQYVKLVSNLNGFNPQFPKLVELVDDVHNPKITTIAIWILKRLINFEIFAGRLKNTIFK